MEIMLFISFAYEDSEHEERMRHALQRAWDAIQPTRSSPVDTLTIVSMHTYESAPYQDAVPKILRQTQYAIALLSPAYVASTGKYGCIEEYNHLIGRHRHAYNYENGRQLLHPIYLQLIANTVDRDRVFKVNPVRVPEYGDKPMLEWEGSRDDHAKVVATIIIDRIMKDLEAGRLCPSQPSSPKPQDRANEPFIINNPSDLEDLIYHGRFTPFLGPQARDMAPAARQHISARWHELQAHLGAGSEAARYAKSVITYHLGKIDTEMPVRRIATDEDMLTFQGAVAQAGLCAVKLFGQLLVKESIGVADSRKAAVPIQPESPDKEERGAVASFRTALQSAMMAAAALPHIGQECIRLDGCCFAGNLVEHLEALETVIFTGKPPSGMRLLFEQVEWLGDLLWHALRYDAPMYPNMEDMSFQLSLCIKADCPQRLPKGLATDARHEHGDTADCIYEMIRRFAEYAGTPEYIDKVDRVIAQYLITRREIPWQQTTQTSSGNTSDAVVAIHPPMHLAITSHIDMSIEHAVVGKAPLWVLFPASVDLPGQSKTYWLLCRHAEDGATDWCIVSEDATKGELIEKVGQEPLLVKYRGSPLHNLRIINKAIAADAFSFIGSKPAIEWDRLKPAILLSDAQLLTDMLDGNRWPKCLAHLLVEPVALPGYNRSGKRFLCFLGYPLEEMGCMLDVAKTSRAYGKQPVYTHSVDPHSSSYADVVLSRLSVQQLPFPMQKVLDTIKKVAHQLAATVQNTQ